MFRYWLMIVRRFIEGCIAGVLLLLAQSCSQPAEKDTDASVQPAPVVVQPLDPVAEKLKAAVNAIESRNLQLGGYQLRYIRVDSITYSRLSMKDYLLMRKAELEKNIAISADKEKTGKAIQYLDNMIRTAPSKNELYKAGYHLDAKAGEFIYNDHRTSYLKPDLTELRIRFPD